VTPAELQAPEGPATREGALVATGSVPKAERLRRIALKEAVDRFKNELMHDEERQLVLDRIRRLRRQVVER
jgi:hypothetical protein